MAECANVDSVPEDQVDGKSCTPQRLCNCCLDRTNPSFAAKYCKNCDQYLCQACEAAHSAFAGCRNHVVMRVDEVEALPPQVDMKRLDLCQDHDGQYLELFCVKHSVLLCYKCAVFTHHDCGKPKRLSEIVADNRPDCSELIGMMDTIKATGEETKKHTKATRIGTVKQLQKCKDLADEVELFYSDLKNDIRERAKAIQKQSASELDKIETWTNEAIEHVERYRKMVHIVNAHGTDEQKMIVLNKLQMDTESYKHSVLNDEDDVYELVLFAECRQALQDIVNHKEHYRNLIAEKVHKSSTDKKEPKSLPLILDVMVHVKKESGDQKEPLYSGLAFLPDGRLVVVDNLNCKLYLLNDKLDKLSEYKLTFQPQSVTAFGVDTVAVTTGGQMELLIFQVDTSNTISLQKTLKTSCQYDSISLMNETTLLVSTIGDTRPVRLISTAGLETDLPELPQKTYAINTSASVYIRKTGTVVITDRNEHAVYLYDNQDCYSTRWVVRDESIRELRGVCEGRDGTVFACSLNSILQLSPTGRVIAVFKPDITNPVCVCMSSDGTKLAIYGGDLGASRLMTYTLTSSKDTNCKT